MEMTLFGGRSNNDSLWGGESSVNSNYGGGGGGGSFRTNPQFFNKRVSTAGQESFRFNKQQSIDSRGQIPKFKKPIQGPNSSRSRTVDPSARSKRSGGNSITI
jgi:hypothetical protein